MTNFVRRDGLFPMHFHFLLEGREKSTEACRAGCENSVINFNQIHPLEDALAEAGNLKALLHVSSDNWNLE